MIINTPIMSIKPFSVKIYDTSTDYKKERVSYGEEYNAGLL